MKFETPPWGLITVCGVGMSNKRWLWLFYFFSSSNVDLGDATVTAFVMASLAPEEVIHLPAGPLAPSPFWALIRQPARPDFD